MKPTWETDDGRVRLYRGDCARVLPAIAGAALVVLDPPYGVTQCHWDVAPDLAAMWSLVWAAAAPGAVAVAFATQPFGSDVIAASRKEFRYDLVWEKSNATGFLDANRRPLRAHEHLLIFSRQGRHTYCPQMGLGRPYHTPHNQPDRCRLYGRHRRMPTVNGGTRYPRSVLHMASERDGHPTAKPVRLLKWLIATYTRPGDTVLDPFMGHGSTGQACVELGRNFIGIEKDRTYFARARARRRIREEEPVLPAA